MKKYRILNIIFICTLIVLTACSNNSEKVNLVGKVTDTKDNSSAVTSANTSPTITDTTQPK